MSISRFAVQRKVTVLMGVLVIILLGGVSYGRLPIDLFPDFSYPAAAILTTYEGAAPAEVEAHVTRPIEQALGTVTNVSRIHSYSQEGLSVVTAEFAWGTSMDFAALEMREKVDLARRYFPAEAGVPTVVKFDPSLMPVMLISLSGGEDPVALRELGDNIVRERLERLPGVAAVSVAGGALLEVAVQAYDDALAQTGVSWAQLRAALRTASVNLPGGRITERDRDFLVRSIGQIEDIEQLREIVVGVRYAGQAPRTYPVPVRLRDVADVVLQNAPGTTRSRLNGNDSLVLSIQKASRGNTVEVARLVTRELQDLKPLLPAGAEFEITMNQAEFINQSVDQVKSSALWGAGLAVAVLFLFLFNLGPVAVIALAIPVSVIGTMILLYFNGLTLNLMTLSGLALGVGMLVDNSIVVLENISRHVQDGEKPAAAAVAGAAEVTTAITASTLTTVAVFLPVVFVGGIAGTLFRELALTVTFALGASLLVAVTFVPMAASLMLRPAGAGGAGNGTSGPGGSGAGAPGGGVANGSGISAGRIYGSAISWALRNRWQVVLFALLLLAVTVRAGLQIGGEFLPRLDRGEFVVTVQMPPGTALTLTDARIAEIEQLAMGIPEVRYVTSTTGSSGPMAMAGGRSGGAASDMGTVTVKLVPKTHRVRATRDVMAEVERLLFIPGARVTFEEMSFFAGAGFVTPVEVFVRGPDMQTLYTLAEQVRREIAAIPGLADLQTSTRRGRPELRIVYDRDKLAAFGLSSLQVADQVKGALGGEVVGSLQPSDSPEIAIVLRYRPEDSTTIDQVRAISIVTPAGQAVRLDAIARITEESGPTIVERESGQRVVALTGQVEGRDLAAVMNDVRRAAAGVELPAGYDIAYGGEGLEMEKAFQSLKQAMWLAVGLVYMVMASQFESLLHPLVIMLTVPMAAVGALLALFLRGQPFSVSSVIGLILLSGIVVNNAIVLIDYVNQLRGRGLARDVALSVAGRDRLRPILMTTLTTILAMVPLAVSSGEGAELAAPMATTVIGGLLTSTLLTLIVIPVMYAAADDAVARVLNRRKAEQFDASDLLD